MEAPLVLEDRERLKNCTVAVPEGWELLSTSAARPVP